MVKVAKTKEGKKERKKELIYHIKKKKTGRNKEYICLSLA